MSAISFANKLRKHHSKNRPTDEQWELIDGVWRRDKNCMGEAVAGSGKTSVILEAMWGKRMNCAYLVFSKEMEMSMKDRIPDWCECRTCHAFGYKPLSKKVGGRLDVQGGGYGKKNLNQQILSQFPGYDLDKAGQEDYAEVKDRINNACKLIDMIRANLVDWNDEAQVDYIADYYGIDLNGMRDELYAVLPKVFDQIIKKGLDGVIDFTSMYWLPVYLELDLGKSFDILFVDEAQDLNNCQRKFVNMLGKNAVICVVGDRNQSIFGFAGATPDSMDRFQEELQPGNYPITYNFRCGRKIIEAVQHIVPQIKAWDGAEEGELVSVKESDFDYMTIPDKSLALSRTNAALVRPAFELLKKGRSANIKGRDLKAGLESLHRKVTKQAGGKEASITMLVGKSMDMEEDEITALSNRKHVSQSLIELTKDKYETLRIVYDQCERPEDVSGQIKSLFDEKKGGIVFSSMHRSKGLEADEVYILNADRMTINHPEMSQWEHQQEINLQYVSQTRAKKKLTKIFKDEKE